MKILKSLLACVAIGLVSTAITTVNTGCQQAPSQRVVQVQTLKAVGQSAEATVALSAQLYRDGKITAAQARQVADFFDSKFQPSFRVAVAAAQANLDSIASPDVLNLATQLSNLVIQFQNQSH
jgi:hypothetical protein